MDFSNLSKAELIEAYGSILDEMRTKNLIRTKNVTGDLGEYLVVDYYTKTKGLPKLQFAPTSTKNIDAISTGGDRYSIKCTTTNTTGSFWGIQKDAAFSETKPLFEYVVIIKLDKSYRMELMLELSWETFFKHKRWRSRIKAYQLTITTALIEDSKVIFRR